MADKLPEWNDPRWKEVNWQEATVKMKSLMDGQTITTVSPFTVRDGELYSFIVAFDNGTFIQFASVAFHGMESAIDVSVIE